MEAAPNQSATQGSGKIAPEWFLLAVVVVWSLSFSLMKKWHITSEDWAGQDLVLQSQASLLLMTVRMGLASICLALFNPGVALAKDRRAWFAGVSVGFCMWAGLALQMLGLALTTPAMSAFFTSLASFFAPLLLACFGFRQDRWLWAGLLVALCGVAVLLEVDRGWRFGLGEGLTLVAALWFALQVIFLDRLGKGVDPTRINLAFFTVNAVASAVLLVILVLWRGNGADFIQWTVGMFSQGEVLLDFALLLVLPTLLGFGWMNKYQPKVSLGRAALIYLLEPVFATLFSLAYQHESLSVHLAAGGCLVLIGNLMGEMGRGKKPEGVPVTETK